jgi:PilZ domain
LSISMDDRQFLVHQVSVNPKTLDEPAPVQITGDGQNGLGESINEGSNMQLTHPERRQLARFPLEVLVRIRIEGAEAADFAQTRNVSARGIYFYTRVPLHIGQELECILILPENLTLASSPMLIGCRARVLRLNKGPEQTVGVAVEVHSCDFSYQENVAIAP